MFRDEEGFTGVAGKIGDVSGKIGDVSGVNGKMGDVSGASTILEVKSFMFEDRRGDEIACLAAKVARLQNEILGVTKWLDARLGILEQVFVEKAGSVSNRLNKIEDDIGDLDNSLKGVKDRLDKLEKPKPPTGPTPPA